MNLKSIIKEVPNYPKEGINFLDITPILQDGDAFKYTIDELSILAKEFKFNKILAPEARGFILGCPLAYNLGCGFVPIRKPNKLPRESISIDYDLEYGKNTLSIHKDSISKDDNVLIVDDLLATGGTICAAIKLVEKLDANVVGCIFIINIESLNGVKKITETCKNKNIKVKWLLSY